MGNGPQPYVPGGEPKGSRFPRGKIPRQQSQIPRTEGPKNPIPEPPKEPRWGRHGRHRRVPGGTSRPVDRSFEKGSGLVVGGVVVPQGGQWIPNPSLRGRPPRRGRKKEKGPAPGLRLWANGGSIHVPIPGSPNGESLPISAGAPTTRGGEKESVPPSRGSGSRPS